MILFELAGTRRDHSACWKLEVANREQQYGFLQIVLFVFLGVGRPFLSQTVIKSVNLRTIAGHHSSAVEYHPCDVFAGEYEPPAQYRGITLMDDFANMVNRPGGSGGPGLVHCVCSSEAKPHSPIPERKRQSRACGLLLPRTVHESWRTSGWQEHPSRTSLQARVARYSVSATGGQSALKNELSVDLAHPSRLNSTLLFEKLNKSRVAIPEARTI